MDKQEHIKRVKRFVIIGRMIFFMWWKVNLSGIHVEFYDEAKKLAR